MVRTRSNVLACSLKGLKTWSGPVLVSSYVRAPLPCYDELFQVSFKFIKFLIGLLYPYLLIDSTYCRYSHGHLCFDKAHVKIDGFWARDMISCVKGYFWPTWRWVNSFFDFCLIRHTFLTFFESPKKLKLPVFELETWFFVWRDVFDQHEHVSTHFLILALLRSKMALWSWAV